MTIPTSLNSELTALQTELAAAEPLSSASSPTILALQLNTAQFLVDLNNQLGISAGALDSWIAPVDPAQIVSGILGLLDNATDQNILANAIGYIGRSNINLDQLV